MNAHFQTILNFLDFVKQAANFSGTGNLSPIQTAGLNAVTATVQALAAKHEGEDAAKAAAAVAGQVMPFAAKLADVIFPQAAPEIDFAAGLLEQIDAAVLAAISSQPVGIIHDFAINPEP